MHSVTFEVHILSTQEGSKVPLKWNVLGNLPVKLIHKLLFLYKLRANTLREESSQTNVILEYKLLASILRAVCSVIQQSWYVLHFYYTLYDGKYDCKITVHYTIFQLQCFVLLNNHQYNCNITKSFLSVWGFEQNSLDITWNKD